MAIQYSISFSDILTILLLAVAAIGIFLTRREIKQNYDVQKATFFKEIYLTLLCDKGFKDTLYLIDHEKFVFDEDFWGSDLERAIDSLLSFVDMMSELYEAKMLSKKEMGFFEYEFRMIYNDRNIQAYLQYLRDLYIDMQTATQPFLCFIRYCENVLLCTPDVSPFRFDTSKSLYNLANWFRDQGKYDAAEALYQRALIIREKLLGPTHPDTDAIRKSYDNLKQHEAKQQNKDVGKA